MSNFICSQYAVHVLLQISSQLPTCTRWLHTFTHPWTKTYNRKDGGHLSKLSDAWPTHFCCLCPTFISKRKTFLMLPVHMFIPMKGMQCVKKENVLTFHIVYRYYSWAFRLFYLFIFFSIYLILLFCFVRTKLESWQRILVLRLSSVGACSWCFNRKQNFRILIFKPIYRLHFSQLIFENLKECLTCGFTYAIL